MKVVREGQQSGNESTAFEKLVPCFASSLRTFGILARSAADWSSVITTRMLGRPSLSAEAGRAVAAPGSARIAAAVTAAIDQRRMTATVHRVSHGVNFSVTLRQMATRPKANIRMTRQQSRDRIVAAATGLNRQTPYAALTVDDVMRKAGAGRTIFYRHFDDLSDLLRRAGREAFEGLFEAEQGFKAAHVEGRPDVRAAVEPAVDVYRRHGPLLRAIAEAAASGDEQIAAGQQAMVERFDGLVEDVLRGTPRLAGRPPEELAELARALNRLNVNYLLDAFGREPRVSADTAVRTLVEIWSGLIEGA